ncbi:amidohydrolase family protein [Paracandidimonas lactea]|uniref:amidohydrolase family protein n=1 Tax=Paracandidimonas lactea TaxID=2895524 RepID=UPI001F40D594|nr:amidohydrolase family protein [Paracandidimonas lactea]
MFEEMDRAGIAAGVMNGRQCTDFRGEVSNADMADVCAKYPGRFYALAGANPFRGQASVQEAETFIREYGFKGIALDPGGYEEQMFADDQRLFPFYELCLKHDFPAVLTLGPMGGAGVHFGGPLQVDRLAAKFPELKIVVSHGCWPYVTEMCGVAARRPNVYLMPDMYHVGMPGHQDYTEAARNIARRRFVFASAYPSRPLEIAVRGYQSLGLPEEVLEEIFRSTAARLMKLDI